jgi:hypothetical protein
MGLSWYPLDSLKLLGFGSAPRQPFSQSGEGWNVGLMMNQDWEKLSLQALYSYESPQSGSGQGIHRAGMSVKADVEAGLMIDALYAYNGEKETEFDGLSFSVVADYSFFDGNLVILVEYLYNGAASSTARETGGSFSNENYLYTGFTWRFSDFTTMSVALISGFDDVSFTPLITLSHELFQGISLTLTAQVPLDRDLFSGDGKRGELGPLPPDELQPKDPGTGDIIHLGRYFNFSAKLRLRF